MTGRTFVRFERGRDDVIGPTLGPFLWAQITYTELRASADPSDNGDLVLATLEADGDWHLSDVAARYAGRTLTPDRNTDPGALRTVQDATNVYSDIIIADQSHDENDGSYLSKPLMETRRRRLFTFTNPILLSHDGSIVATAAEGVEDDTAENGMRFLVLDAVWDGKEMKRIQLDGLDHVIGAWFNTSVIASEQVQAASLTTPRSIRDIGRRT